MNAHSLWNNLDVKLIVILRGIETSNVPDIVSGLIKSGIHAIEIPLNSPKPFNSIEVAVKTAEKLLPGKCLIGAGTVLTDEDVKRVHAVGGNLIVSPNVDRQVIEATVNANMLSLPGVFTPTEAHLAIRSGAHGLKFFPASILGASGIKAIKTILPNDTSICAVGGVNPDDFKLYRNAGVEGFGLGSWLYTPGMASEETSKRAALAVKHYSELT